MSEKGPSSCHEQLAGTATFFKRGRRSCLRRLFVEHLGGRETDASRLICRAILLGGIAGSSRAAVGLRPRSTTSATSSGGSALGITS